MRILFLLLIALVSFGSPLSASAQTCPPGQVPTNVQSSTDYTCEAAGTGGYQSGGVGTGGGTTLINPLQGGASLEEFLISILDFVIRIGTIVVILMLVYVGFKFVVAQGSDSKITEAKQMLLWTLVGALILLGAKAIAIGIEQTVQALSVGR